MADLGKFDVTGQEEMNDFTPLPTGDYLVAIKKSEMKANKAGTGKYLSLQFEVKEGKFKNRILFSILNLDHPNAEAVSMARKELTSITKACGLTVIQDSDELHGISMMASVVVKAATANNPAGNDIKGYKSANGMATSSPITGGADVAASAPKKPKVSFD